MTDAEGLTTTYAYDALGRVISETKSGGAIRPDTTTTTTYDPEDRVLSRMVTAGGLSETETYEYDALGRTVATMDAAGIETRYFYATDATAGLETRSTIRAVGTAQAVTNTTISYADGRTKETRLNGVVKTAYEYGPNWTKTYEGPAGLASLELFLRRLARSHGLRGPHRLPGRASRHLERVQHGEPARRDAHLFLTFTFFFTCSARLQLFLL